MDKTKAEPFRMLGDLYKKLGRTQPAIESYKQYLELSPNSIYKESINNFINKME